MQAFLGAVVLNQRFDYGRARIPRYGQVDRRPTILSILNQERLGNVVGDYVNNVVGRRELIGRPPTIPALAGALSAVDLVDQGMEQSWMRRRCPSGAPGTVHHDRFQEGRIGLIRWGCTYVFI